MTTFGGHQRSRPLSHVAVLLMLISWAPLRVLAFFIPSFSGPSWQPRQQRLPGRTERHIQRSLYFVGHVVAVTPPCRPSLSGSTRKSKHASIVNGGATPSLRMASSRWQPRTQAWRENSSGPLQRYQRGWSTQAAVTSVDKNKNINSNRGRGTFAVLKAGGGDGESSRRRSDDVDRGDRKKSRKGRGGGRGKGKKQEAGDGGGMPFLDVEWGGEARLSNLEDKVPAEFSRAIDCSELSRKARYYTVEATTTEGKALAKRFSLEGVNSLKADLRVMRGAGRDSRKIKVKGRVVAEVCQLCASTLKPFNISVEEEFDTVVQEVSLDNVDSTLWALESDTDTDDEIMEGDPLDLGEVAAQAMALCIDPFARDPNRPQGDEEDDNERGVRAFNVLNEGFAVPQGSGDVMDVETMRAFFDADD